MGAVELREEEVARYTIRAVESRQPANEGVPIAIHRKLKASRARHSRADLSFFEPRVRYPSTERRLSGQRCSPTPLQWRWWSRKRVCLCDLLTAKYAFLSVRVGLVGEIGAARGRKSARRH